MGRSRSRSQDKQKKEELDYYRSKVQNKKNKTKFSTAETTEYVQKSINQGYSLNQAQLNDILNGSKAIDSQLLEQLIQQEKSSMFRSEDTEINGLLSAQVSRDLFNNGPIPQLTSTTLNEKSILSCLNDVNKVKRKIYVPCGQNYNFIGLIVGPSGNKQKQLEQDHNVKIFIRGKGNSKDILSEEEYLIVVGDNEQNVSQCQLEIERIFFADEDTRNRIRAEQLLEVAEIKTKPFMQFQSIGQQFRNDPSMTTPEGLPAEDAFIIPIPEQCVGLVIGKGGEAIRILKETSKARNVQMAMGPGERGDVRNVFVEGDNQAVENVKRQLAEVVENWRRIQSNFAPQQSIFDRNQDQKVEYQVPLNMIGLIIGKNGSTIGSINKRTGAVCMLSRLPEHNQNQFKVINIEGNPHQIQLAKQEIEAIVTNGLEKKGLNIEVQKVEPRQMHMFYEQLLQNQKMMQMQLLQQQQQSAQLQQQSLYKQ